MIKLISIFLILIFLSQCSQVKDGLTLRKENKAEEFLIEKKSPLVLPPDFGNLPSPKNILNETSEQNNDEVENLFKKEVSNHSTKKQLSDTTSKIEDSILKKIESK